MNLSQTVLKKYQDLFEQEGEEGDREPIQLQDVKSLQLIFAYYEDQLCFLKEELERAINDTVELKIKEVEIHLSQQNIAKRNQNSVQNQMVLRVQEEEKVKSLLKQNQQLKRIIESERELFQKKQFEYSQSQKLYKQQFLSELNDLLDLERKKQSEKQQNLCKELQKKLKRNDQKLHDIIDNVNDVLEINFKGADDIQEWMRIFKKEVEHYKREIEKYLDDKTQKKAQSQIRKIAELQKKKIASRQMYLLKTLKNN